LIDQEIGGSYYETENFAPIIDAMVKHNVAWTPTIAKWLRPLKPECGALPGARGGDPRQPQFGLPGAVRAVTELAYNKFAKRYTKEAARAHEDLLRQIQRLHPPLRRGRRAAQGGLRPAARHGGHADARGAGDGCRGPA